MTPVVKKDAVAASELRQCRSPIFIASVPSGGETRLS